MFTIDVYRTEAFYITNILLTFAFRFQIEVVLFIISSDFLFVFCKMLATRSWRLELLVLPGRVAWSARQDIFENRISVPGRSSPPSALSKPAGDGTIVDRP